MADVESAGGCAPQARPGRTAQIRKIFDSIWLGRGLLFVMGASLISSGLARLLKNQLHYANYWGGAVFAPLAILIGLFCWGFLVTHWRTLNESSETRKPPTRPRERRRERQAKETRFPIDDFDKPWRGQ
jgi:hypothetical protein